MGGKTLTRADLVNAITNEFRVTKFDASEILEDILDEVVLALTRSEQVKINGFGTFSIRRKNERMGRNPKTMEQAVISARKSLSFKTSAVLKKIVNGERDIKE